MSKYDPQSYRIYLMNSVNNDNKHILVEGKDDKYLIARLWQDLARKNDLSGADKILIDSADHLIKEDESNSPLNNRQKVELIASSVNGKAYDYGFIGFVDRELDEFRWDYQIDVDLQDLVESHQAINRLVLSRGHSIENYIFDFSILHEVLEYLSTTPYSSQALELFKEVFHPVLCIACAVGLAAAKSQVLSRISSTIDYSLLQINTNKEVIFSFDAWTQKLNGRGVTSTQIRELEVHYTIYVEQVSRASLSLVRWICHGHVGYDFLRSLYERCVFDSCPNIHDKTKELSSISWIAKDKMLYSFINSWVKRSLQSQCEYPASIFDLLNLSC